MQSYFNDINTQNYLNNHEWYRNPRKAADDINNIHLTDSPITWTRILVGTGFAITAVVGVALFFTLSVGTGGLFGLGCLAAVGIVGTVGCLTL